MGGSAFELSSFCVLSAWICGAASRFFGFLARLHKFLRQYRRPLSSPYPPMAHGLAGVPVKIQ